LLTGYFPSLCDHQTELNVPIQQAAAASFPRDEALQIAGLLAFQTKTGRRQRVVPTA
jgi:hypothetical protein